MWLQAWLIQERQGKYLQFWLLASLAWSPFDIAHLARNHWYYKSLTAFKLKYFIASSKNIFQIFFYDCSYLLPRNVCLATF